RPRRRRGGEHNDACSGSMILWNRGRRSSCLIIAVQFVGALVETSPHFGGACENPKWSDSPGVTFHTALVCRAAVRRLYFLFVLMLFFELGACNFSCASALSNPTVGTAQRRMDSVPG